MRQGTNPKRLRGRTGHKNPNTRSQNFESSGPEVKVRGNAQQVVEKYLALARDASLAGDRITAESYFQHAEHYYRVMTANGTGEGRNAQNGRQNGEHGERDGQNGRGEHGEDGAPAIEIVANGGAAHAEAHENGANGAVANSATGDPADKPQPQD